MRYLTLHDPTLKTIDVLEKNFPGKEKQFHMGGHMNT